MLVYISWKSSVLSFMCTLNQDCFAIAFQVSSPAVIDSAVHLILVTLRRSSTIFLNRLSDLVENEEDFNELLADAIISNLVMRKASDVKVEYTLINLDDTNDVQELCQRLGDSLNNSELSQSHKMFFVFLGPKFGVFGVEIIQSIQSWSLANSKVIYGVHFQNLTTMRGRKLMHIMKQKELNTDFHEFLFPVTGCLSGNTVSCVVSFPLLLYLIHLVIGENGPRKFLIEEKPFEGKLLFFLIYLDLILSNVIKPFHTTQHTFSTCQLGVFCIM